MNCLKCGAPNRDGASYCDSCGEPLTADASPRTEPEFTEGLYQGMDHDEPLLEKGGLVGWMAIDWTLRFGMVAVIGILVGFLTIGMGEYGYSAFFFILGAVGIVGTWAMLRAKA